MDVGVGAVQSCESPQCAHVQVVVISGRPENVEAAKEKVQEMVRAKLEGGQSQTVVMSVPLHAVGRIIGRGGANIRCLQRESGAKVRPMSVHFDLCHVLSGLLDNSASGTSDGGRGGGGV